MNEFLSGLFPLTAYKTAEARERASMIYVTGLLPLFILPVLAVVRVTSRGDILNTTQGLIALVMAIFLVVMIVATYISNRHGSPQAPLIATGLIAMQAVAAVIIGFSAMHMVMGLLIVSVGVMLGWRAAAISAVSASLVLLVYGVIQPSVFPLHPPTTIIAQIQVIPILLGISVLVFFFLRLQRGTAADSALAASQSRLRLAQITTGISSRITQQAPTEQVLSNAVALIVESYPAIYHAQVFLIENESQIARLTASTGEAGRLLLERQHGLPVASQSVIGQVTGSGTTVVTRAGEPVHRPNPLLPDTAAEAAFPLKLGDLIIGALDLQSRLPDAFAEEDLPIFQALADTIAVVIDNDRLAAETQFRLQENQRLLEEARAASREVERLNRQLTREGWDRLLTESRSHYAVELDLQSGMVQRETDSPTLQQAVRDAVTVQAVRDNVHVVAVPLRVRGQVIGAMEFEVEGGPLDPDDQTLLETVGDRLGTALDTIRLYQETERLAQRESRLNVLGQRMSSANHIDTLLAETARGLQDTLSAGRVAIRLGTPKTDNGGSR